MKNKLLGLDEAIFEAYDAGCNTRELARRFNVSTSAMRQYLIAKGRDTSRRVPVTINALSATEAAYIAGIIDGEGCLSVRWVKSRGSMTVQSSLTVANTREALVKYLQDIVGGGHVRACQRFGVQGENYRQLWVWTASSWQAHQLLRQISPYLVIKREQASLFMELSELKAKSTPRKRFNEDRQHQIVERMAILNQRGNKTLPLD